MREYEIVTIECFLVEVIIAKRFTRYPCLSCQKGKGEAVGAVVIVREIETPRCLSIILMSCVN